MVTVSTDFDVFPWDLDTVIIWLSCTGDLNRNGVKGHPWVFNLLVKVLKKVVTV